MRLPSRRTTGLLAYSAACLWVVACIGSTDVDSSYVMGRVWLVTTYAVPVVFALGGALLQEPATNVAHASAAVRWGLSAGILVGLMGGYVMCVAVIEQISRMLSLINYDGRTSLSRSTAEFLLPPWIGFAMAVYALRRWAAVGTRFGFLGRAALALVVSASMLGLLFLLGMNSRVGWRP